MKTITRLAILTLGSAIVILAQPSGDHRRGPPGPGRGQPVVHVLDANHDFEISAEEIANAPSALRSLDANGDGEVTFPEMLPPRPAGAPQPPPAAPQRRGPRDNGGRPRPAFPVMLALDANADGKLSAGEITNASASLRTLDANGDGRLTHEELRPLPPQRE